MKKYISISLCLLLLFVSVLAFANKTQVGAFKEVKNSVAMNTISANQPEGLLLVAAFVLGFYNGYMDTKTDYGKDGEVLALNIGYDKEDFSRFDN
ncbi:MAG: hypothetical protein REI64_03160 [Pedobacter sp.]|uniref:hypothetical protein n=1 Tax=Pedobacter sp. TaxID=1411316 RepID=UPI0028099F96|nr:hypothetical protein [Pedobacter sp.]MDQ8003771.1 hypothetical protein [Pedobacter sp.]